MSETTNPGVNLAPMRGPRGQVNSVGLRHDAVAVTAIRILRNGGMVQYTATTFPKDPWQGCEHLIRTGLHLGMLKPSSPEPSYGVLDVLNEDGDIVQDFDITTALAFRYLKRRCGWQVERDQ